MAVVLKELLKSLDAAVDVVEVTFGLAIVSSKSFLDRFTAADNESFVSSYVML